MQIRPTLSASLAPRQSVALWVITMTGLAAVAITLRSLAASVESLVTWCQNFVVAASAGRGAAAIATAAALASLMAASLVNVAYFAFSEVRAALRLRVIVRRRAVVTPGRVLAALANADVTVPCTVIEDVAPYALTVGLLRPRILLSASFAGALTLSELRAVLRHEAFHAQAHHPLRAVAWEVLRRVFFFLPSVRDVSGHFALMRELAADDHSHDNHAHIRPLATALLKALERGSSADLVLPGCAAPFGHLQARIAALARGRRITMFQFSSHRALVTFAAMLLVAAVQVSVGTGQASAQAPPDGGRCLNTSRSQQMSMVNFSPYFSIMVSQMSTDPPQPASTSAVQSLENPR